MLGLITATAIASFVAMSLLWSPLVAGVILVVVAFHEAGHAVAMRLVGYRDVHVFFVPLLGAMTVGSGATATVRGQMTMLLAGPVPGLLLAVALLVVDQSVGPVGLLRAAALSFLLINALNLLPVTPFDGATARLLARQFSQPHATGADQVWGVVAYVAAWVPFVIAALLWRT